MGEIFSIDVGIEQNHSVIDFGCGKGAYVIPAARIVGEIGKVYAVDKKNHKNYIHYAYWLNRSALWEKSGHCMQ
jgi:tRNA A58 N-methylase Trm61